MALGDLSAADLLALANAQIATISGDLASYPGVTRAMMTDLGNRRDDLADMLLAHTQAQEAAKAATISKDNAMFAVIELLRSIRELIKANNVADDKYAALGFPQAESGAPTTATVPIATIDNRERLRQTINFSDAANPGNKRRPRGVDGCEIWLKIGDPAPGSEKDCVFLTLDTRTPHVVDFDPEDAGKTAHYLLRWQFRDGSKSAWSETLSATITA